MYEAEQPEEKISALQTNAQAVRAVRSAIEGTIGPKGLDTMLVRRDGSVLITNDGVTILEEMEAEHPAARMLVHLARSQQNVIGDGTTTATLFCASLVLAGAEQVAKGIPITKLIEGIQLGTTAALQCLETELRQAVTPDMLRQVALIAGRGQAALAELIVQGAQGVGREKLCQQHFRLAEQICVQEQAQPEVFAGVLITKERMSTEMPLQRENTRVLIVDDALEPEELQAEALAVESGLQRYLALQEEFRENLQKLVSLDVGLVLVDRNIAPMAEEFFVDAGILALRRVEHKELAAAAEYTGARLIKRTGLKKSTADLARFLGCTHLVREDEKLRQVRITGGSGKAAVTILVGAATKENALECYRIACDAASSVQAAVQSGCVAGGGAAEIAMARAVRQCRTEVSGMAAYGVDCVIQALEAPVAQMVKNAGYNPLEKIEEIIAAQNSSGSNTIGINCESGKLQDMLLAEVLDSAAVKAHALQAAVEVAISILKIEKIIRGKTAIVAPLSE